MGQQQQQLMMDPNEKWWDPLPGSAEEAANRAFEAFSHA
jgi:hypothetical protein